MVYQTTIKKEIYLTGVGLHTGKKTSLTLLPAEADTGVVFVRNKKSLKADYRNIFSSDFAISLKKGNIKVKTIEHLLAAFYGLEIDNCFCRLDSDEIPFLDGSSFGFVHILNKTGIKKLRKSRKQIFLKENIVVSDNDRFIIAEPFKGLKISYYVKYEHPLIGEMFKKLKLTKDYFIKEISKARTFGWKEQLEKQKKAGLIKGGSLSSGILFGKNKVVNKEGLRYKDEVIRHKILDLTGALALLPGRLNAHIIAFKSGHNLDTKLVEKIGGHVWRKK